MDVREIDRRDEEAVRRSWEIGKAAEAYRPYDFYPPWETRWLSSSQDRDDAEILTLGAYDEGGTMTGTARMFLPLLDNLHVANVHVHVHPEHQRRGLGTALVTASYDAARERKRSVVMSETYTPPEEDAPGLLFARALGFAVALEEGMKVVDLVDTEPTWAAIEKDIEARHADYQVVTWQRRVPDEYIEDVCRINEIFVEQAPMGDLTLEREKWDEARIRQREAIFAASGRHDVGAGAVAPDGHLVAMTEIGYNEHAPQHAWQSGTLVVPEHRGHALGLAVKLANHRQMRADYPQCRVLQTGNADVNAPMNAVNDRLGYRFVERCVELQREL